MRPERVVVCGAPGAGKTTWVRGRARPGDVVFDYDAIVSALTGLPMHAQPEDLIPAVSAMREALVRSIQAGHVQRRVFLIAADPAQAQRIAWRIGARLVRLVCAEAERRERLAERAEAGV